jgi:hypothetical protein
MRTTLTIDDEVLALAQEIARARKVSTGKALSDLARRGHRAGIGTRRVGPFAVFAVSADTPAIDPDAVREAEVAEDRTTYGGQLK